MPAKQAQAGFTLIELIVIMILLGVLSAVAYPRLSGTQFDEVGFRDQVAATLGYARKAAVAQRRNVSVSLSGNTLKFRIANDTPDVTGQFIVPAVESHDLLLPGVGAAQIIPRGAATLSGPAKLVFSPLGAAPPGTYIYTINSSTARSVTVDFVSGYVY